ncbi:MAG: hypothetical protein ABIK89_05490 [Planctomycetota bacterium]
MATYEEQIRAMNEVFKDSESPIFSAMDVTKIDVDGTPGLKVEMKMPTPPGMADIPQFAGLMENLFGPGGTMTVFIAPVDEHTIVGAYTSEKTLRLCLEAAKRPHRSPESDQHVRGCGSEERGRETRKQYCLGIGGERVRRRADLGRRSCGGRPATRINAEAAWSPDGKTIVFPSGRRK